MLSRVVSYDVEVRQTKDVQLTHPWNIVICAKRVSNDPKAAAVDVLSSSLGWLPKSVAEGMSQRGDDEGEGTWWILVGESMYSVKVTFESEAARLSFAVFELFKVWPYKNSWGERAVELSQAVAEAYGLDCDELILAFSEEWSARYWLPNLDDKRMDRAIQELVTIWGPEYSMSEDDLRTVKHIATEYDVNWAKLYGEFVEEDHRMSREQESEDA